MQLQAPQQPLHPVASADPSLPEVSGYEQQVMERSNSGGVSSMFEDLGGTMVQEQSETHTVPDAVVDPTVMPPWFGPVQQQLDDMQASLRNIIANQVKIANAANGNGSIYQFEIVPFIDGTNPTAPPHNLPLLASSADVKGLSRENAGLYLIGYGVRDIPRSVAARRQLIKLHIGCRAS